jgi:hypothetical protein
MIKKNILAGMDIQPTIKLLIFHLYLRGNQMSDIHFIYDIKVTRVIFWISLIFWINKIYC